uniref:Uncharacterized protein n=1 Tax=viral metagenome TaxID=1070528 RepID=A0A6C0DX48_9ZZZZ
MSFNLNSISKNYIILTNNMINNNNEGTLIFLNSSVLPSSTSVISKFQETIGSLSNYNNRIILSYSVRSRPNFSNTSKNCLLTLNNIKNNMKFLFIDSNKNGKLLFIKNNKNYQLSNNYLIDFPTTDILLNKTVHLNYYFNNININSNFYNANISNTNTSNYDYYKINVKDYLFKHYNTAFFNFNDICYNILRFIITSAGNLNNLYLDNKSDFSPITDITNINTLEKGRLNSENYPTINPLYNIDSSYNIYRNIYNKYTKYNEPISYTISIINSNTRTINFFGGLSLVSFTLSNIRINLETFLIKTNNFDMLRNSQSKILFDTNNTIYFSNVKVSTPSKQIDFPTKTAYPHIIYLSLGSSKTGLTQYDIYNNITFTPSFEKIIFKENINTNVINTSAIAVQKKYNSLIAYQSNNYLYDINLLDNSLFKTITTNNSFNSSSKIFAIDFSRFFNITDLRAYYNTFNNLAFTSNVNNIIKPRVNYFDSATNYNNTLIKFDITPTINTFIYTGSLVSQNLFKHDYYYDLLNPAFLDVRFNYNSYFNIELSFNILYNPNTAIREIINNYSINIECFIYTTPGRDFTDVECIYIYHNPDTETDPSFRYPYSNIEIIRDPTNIDTLSKAIELLPNASRSNLNSTIIPEKNGSNYSRKMIEGLIGLNDIPKLLSIKPYDPNVIVGRGFVNRFQIDDDCNFNAEYVIKNKINANKHISAKETVNNTLAKQNFANLVRSSARNRLSQECIANLRQDINNNTALSTQINYANIIPYTPRFRIFKTGKGHYL